jgi:hypothetical protein
MAAGGIVLVAGVGSVAFGPGGNLERHRRYYAEIVVPYGEGGADAIIERPWRANNQSLTAAAYRFLVPPEVTEEGPHRFVQIARLPAETVRRGAKTVALLLTALLFVLWWAGGRRDSPVARAAGLGSALIAMLEVSEMSGTGHHALLVVPLAAAIAFAAATGRPPRARGRVVRGTLAAMILVWACAVPFLKDLSFLLFGTLTLLGVMVVILRAERPRAPDPGAAGGGSAPAV